MTTALARPKSSITHTENWVLEKFVFVPVRSPSQNDFTGYHWSTYRSKYKKWLVFLKLMLRERMPHEVKVRKRVRIITYHDHFYDKVNHEGGCKPILDSLKELGWIYNDTIKWLDDSYDQRKIGEDGVREQGTLIEVYKNG
jgi:hypothetical protein